MIALSLSGVRFVLFTRVQGCTCPAGFGLIAFWDVLVKQLARGLIQIDDFGKLNVCMLRCAQLSRIRASETLTRRIPSRRRRCP